MLPSELFIWIKMFPISGAQSVDAGNLRPGLKKSGAEDRSRPTGEPPFLSLRPAKSSLAFITYWSSLEICSKYNILYITVQKTQGPQRTSFSKYFPRTIARNS